MGQVAITLNDRTYRLVCDDGEEDHLAHLALIVKAKIETLRADVGHVGDERLMLMAALLIADDLVELRATAAKQMRGETERFDVEPIVDTNTENHEPAHSEPAQRLRAAAARMAVGARPREALSIDGAGGAATGSVGKARKKDLA
jgi:cell division protein ZapA